MKIHKHKQRLYKVKAIKDKLFRARASLSRHRGLCCLVAQGCQCDCKRNGCLFDFHSEKWFFFFHLLGLVTGKSAEFCHSTRQCLQNSAERWERSVLTLGSLCPPCRVRDTAWSWFLIYLYLYFNYLSLKYL